MTGRPRTKLEAGNPLVHAHDARITGLELGLAATAGVILAVYRRIYASPWISQKDKDELTALIREMKAHVFGEDS